MSLARIYTTKKVRKDWTCEKCKSPIRKGIDGRISYAVGFRGYEHTRCTKPECRPTRSELESSAVGSVYAAQDDVDVSTFDTTEDFTNARDEIAATAQEVADDYESNEMFEINYDLQERAEMLSSAADELSNWEPDNEEPTEDEDRFQDMQCVDCEGTGKIQIESSAIPNDCDTCNGDGLVEAEESFEEIKEVWLEETRESFETAVNDMELP